MLNREINTAGWVKKEAACYTVTFSFHFLLQDKDPVTLEETLFIPHEQAGGDSGEEKCPSNRKSAVAERLSLI